MRLIVAGTPATALPVFDRLSQEHQIMAVLTRPPAPQGRSSRLVPSPVGQWAQARGIEVLTPSKLRDPEFVALVRQLEPDCCPVVAYGGLITQELLDIPRFGWINLHFSLLPAYRGAAPVQRALLDGCARTGVTVFRLVKALDAGPVFLQREVDVDPGETAGDLLERLSVLGAEAMAEVVENLGRSDQPREQRDQGVSLAPKVTADEARLTMGQSGDDIVRRVRAMSPDPGAWALLGSDRFKILRAAVVEGLEDAAGSDRFEILRSAGADGLQAAIGAESTPGSLWATKKALYCRVGDGWIELIHVVPSGKKPMSGAEWARGAWKPGVRLA